MLHQTPHDKLLAHERTRETPQATTTATPLYIVLAHYLTFDVS